MPEQQTRLLAERYELISPLGRGTMGTVWRARDRALGREVAVKEIRQDPGLTEEQRAELRERMVREGRIAARISHPAVAAIHDVLVHDNSPWIIMELIEARSLEQVIDEEGPLPPRLVAEIGVDLLGALRAAHAQGITHRDVKPGNVLITESGRVVLTDFGIAKAEGDSRLTRTGMVIGSPGYTAPERARGEYTGPESDIWSLGATLYFAVEGRPAYERSTIAETLAALLSESADPPTQAGQLRPVLDGLLHKNYKQRLNAAKAETMLRMVADTPTSEMPAITGEALNQESPLSQPASRPQPVPPATPGPGAGTPASSEVGSAFAPGAAAPVQLGGPGAVADSDRTVSLQRPKSPFPQPAPPRTPPAPQSPPQGRPAQGTPPHGGPGHAPQPPSPQPPTPQGPYAPGPQGPGPQGPGPHAPGPQGQGPHGPGPRANGPQGPGPQAPAPHGPGPQGTGPQAAGPQGPQGRGPQAQGPQGPGPQGAGRPGPVGKAGDESTIVTTRIQLPSAPGLQVYPPTPQQQRPQQPAPGQPQQGPYPPGPQQPERPDSHGLGTDLFAIAGPDEPASGNRKGMLMLMGVAAAAAVVIAILIVALLQS
ncbi:serine/threonine-protein kinase [Nonomuraea ceibae]|uniref:serine/threonine-protein kinase n=1 Tax=Nonomuraea ceibae TaxID=1935170 RepID=UPI001C5E6821|nr:serine/threonine-protein kinase [Nonomuraea ceibae]